MGGQGMELLCGLLWAPGRGVSVMQTSHALADAVQSLYNVLSWAKSSIVCKNT